MLSVGSYNILIRFSHKMILYGLSILSSFYFIDCFSFTFCINVIMHVPYVHVIFFYSRNPNGPYSIPTSWPQYDMTSQKYLDITQQMTTASVKQRIAARRMEFWLRLLPDLLKSQQ